MLAQPSNQPFTFTLRHNGRPVYFRGLIRHLPDGHYLLVAHDMTSSRAVFGNLVLESCAIRGAVLATVLLRPDRGGHRRRRCSSPHRRRHTPPFSVSFAAISRAGCPRAGIPATSTGWRKKSTSCWLKSRRLMLEVKGVCDNVAHDLRTPLTRLLASGWSVHAAARDQREDYAARSRRGHRGEIRGLLKTFAAVLRIAEVESGARRAGFAYLDLSEIGADVVEFYAPIAEQKGRRAVAGRRPLRWYDARRSQPVVRGHRQSGGQRAEVHATWWPG